PLTLRYEDLVTDLRGTVEPVLSALGLDWNNGILAYQSTAASRQSINTPSYKQVTQDLYTRSSGRWENYREQMEPVLPVLAPWISRWGYDI
ncbi:MAG: sulfotransferase family protein, partial [Pseudomonadota bacterium]